MVLKWVGLGLLCFKVSEAQILPMHPLFKKTNNEFIGVMIPLSRPYEDPNRITISNILRSPDQSEALRQVSELGLNAYLWNGHVYGTVKKISQISHMNRTTIGFQFGDVCGNDALCFGNDTVYGIRSNLISSPAADFRTMQGSYFTDPISAVIQIGGVLLERQNSFDTVKNLILLTNSLARNRKARDALDWPEAESTNLKSVNLSDQMIPSQMNIRPNRLTTWQKNESDFKDQKKLEREQSWNSSIGNTNQYAPIWDNEEAQVYLQSLCNRIAPQTPLAPRCRIFASLWPYAFSYPGGDIFITAGLLAAIRNEATLVFFLAHEMAHIYGRHFSKNIEKKEYYIKMMNTISLATQLISIPVISAKLSEEGELDTNTLTVGKMYQSLMTEYTVDNEFDADQAGFQVAIESGFSRGEILEGLENLGELLENDFSLESDSSVMKTRYPSWRGRLSKIQSLSIIESLGQAELNEDLYKFQNLLKPSFNAFKFTVKANTLAARKN